MLENRQKACPWRPAVSPSNPSRRACPERSRRVYVAMSGGVDSSVAAALLQERGFDVRGVHIKMWSPLQARTNADLETQTNADLTRTNADDTRASADLNIVCKQQYQDRLDAMRVAAKLNIPFETWDFTKEYKEAVVEYMIKEYAAGRTPNPDVMCNRRIKFGVFLERALVKGADYVATGHYIRLMRKSETQNTKSETNHKSQTKNSKLLIAKDTNKDQSYFLWTLTQEQLKHCLFPIGEYTKPEVRELARKFDLPTAEKKDSQGLCFIGKIDVREFLKTHIPERRGAVITAAGKEVGEHDGLEFRTIGQRHGIGIGGGKPYFVAEKNFASNTLVVAEDKNDPALYRSELAAADVNWVSGLKPRLPLRCRARIRYRQPLQSCLIEAQKSADLTLTDAENSAFVRVPSAGVRVLFERGQRAIAPGQSVVFYKDDPFDPARGKEMLGGGVIG